MTSIYIDGQKISKADQKNYEYVYAGERPLGLRKMGGEKTDEVKKVSGDSGYGVIV